MLNHWILDISRLNFRILNLSFDSHPVLMNLFDGILKKLRFCADFFVLKLFYDAIAVHRDCYAEKRVLVKLTLKFAAEFQETRCLDST